MWLSKMWPLGLGTGRKWQVGVRWLEGEDLWNPVHMGMGGEGCCRCFAPELGMRLSGFGEEEWWRLSVCLSIFLALPSWCVPSECPLLLETGILGWVGEQEGWRRSFDPLGMGLERKGWPQQIFCYRAWDKTGALNLGNKKELKTLLKIIPCEF